MFLLFLNAVVSIMVREISQEPYCHGADKYDTAHLLQILTTLLPCMSEDGLAGRDAVWWKFHYERQVIILEERTHDLCCEYCQNDSQCIES